MTTIQNTQSQRVALCDLGDAPIGCHAEVPRCDDPAIAYMDLKEPARRVWGEARQPCWSPLDALPLPDAVSLRDAAPVAVRSRVHAALWGMMIRNPRVLREQWIAQTPRDASVLVFVPEDTELAPLTVQVNTRLPTAKLGFWQQLACWVGRGQRLPIAPTYWDVVPPEPVMTGALAGTCPGSPVREIPGVHLGWYAGMEQALLKLRAEWPEYFNDPELGDARLMEAVTGEPVDRWVAQPEAKIRPENDAPRSHMPQAAIDAVTAAFAAEHEATSSNPPSQQSRPVAVLTDRHGKTYTVATITDGVWRLCAKPSGVSTDIERHAWTSEALRDRAVEILCTRPQVHANRETMVTRALLRAAVTSFHEKCESLPAQFDELDDTLTELYDLVPALKRLTWRSLAHAVVGLRALDTPTPAQQRLLSTLQQLLDLSRREIAQSYLRLDRARYSVQGRDAKIFVDGKLWLCLRSADAGRWVLVCPPDKAPAWVIRGNDGLYRALEPLPERSDGGAEQWLIPIAPGLVTQARRTAAGEWQVYTRDDQWTDLIRTENGAWLLPDLFVANPITRERVQLATDVRSAANGWFAQDDTGQWLWAPREDDGTWLPPRNTARTFAEQCLARVSENALINSLSWFFGRASRVCSSPASEHDLVPTSLND